MTDKSKTIHVARGAQLFHAFRERLGLSQVDAGEQLSVSGPTVSAWESGAKRPKAHVRTRIAEWSDEEVPVDSWLLDSERVRQRRATPKPQKRAA